MSDKATVIFTTTDPLGSSITLNKPTWDKHIVSGHPEMQGNEKAVQKVIEEPEAIYRSTKSPDADVFYAKSHESTFPSLFTRVIVGYVGENKGVVKTAFFTKKIDDVKKGELKYENKKT